mmetsp:Transcript_24662/g.18674  ORF Transcript_24662/g.18674 Transcript_24662/m.18674 type:complete len:87 (+) Transcript_24662:186-446(+)
MYIIEELFYAALDLRQYDWAEAFLRIIGNMFPQSAKAMRLLGMLYESQTDIIKAQDVYLELLQQHPSDSQTVKRLVAIYRDTDLLP